MHATRCAMSLVALIVTSVVAAAPVTAIFDSGGLEIHARAGGHVAWLTVMHERRRELMAVHSNRGVGATNNSGQLRVDMKREAGSRTLAVAADLDTGETLLIAPPDYGISAVPVPVEAEVGGSTFVVSAPVARLLYVRPGKGAWAFSGLEGSEADRDGLSNAHLVVALADLSSIHGNEVPPSTAEAGDVILAIDARWMRIGKKVVGR